MTMEKGTEKEKKAKEGIWHKKDWLFGTFHPTWKAIGSPLPVPVFRLSGSGFLPVGELRSALVSLGPSSTRDP